MIKKILDFWIDNSTQEQIENCVIEIDSQTFGQLIEEYNFHLKKVGDPYGHKGHPLKKYRNIEINVINSQIKFIKLS